MKITYKQLVESETDCEGLMYFSLLYPSGVMEVEWSLEAQLEQ